MTDRAAKARVGQNRQVDGCFGGGGCVHCGESNSVCTRVDWQLHSVINPFGRVHTRLLFSAASALILH